MTLTSVRCAPTYRPNPKAAVRRASRRWYGLANARPERQSPPRNLVIGWMSVTLRYFSRAAYRAFTTAKNGPTLYDLCDPLLAGSGEGNPHLRKFYRKVLANPALRLLLSRAGVPQLRDEARFQALSAALRAARDDTSPDWAAVGTPLAALLDAFPQKHGIRAAAAPPDRMPSRTEVEQIIGACARHLLNSFAKNKFIPVYAAFKLVGDPDFRGRDLLRALEGLNARTYKNATLLFNLARVFILANPHIAALINPPWRGLAEPMWEPVQIRHRSAYYDAFFSEALMDFIGSGLATGRETEAARHAVEAMIHFCLNTSREGVRALHDGAPFNVITALARPPHSRMSRFFWQLKSDLGFGVYVPDFDTTVCSFSAATQFGCRGPNSRAVTARFSGRLPGRQRQLRSPANGHDQRHH